MFSCISLSVLIDFLLARRRLLLYNRMGSVTLSVVRNDDTDQKELEWIQSSLLFALRILPAHAALSLDVAVVR